jgi:hypothetical protein
LQWRVRLDVQDLRKDEAIDAATFVALRELRERLERSELPRRQFG